MLKFNKNTEYHHCYHLLAGAYAGVIIFLKIIVKNEYKTYNVFLGLTVFNCNNIYTFFCIMTCANHLYKKKHI